MRRIVLLTTEDERTIAEKVAHSTEGVLKACAQELMADPDTRPLFIQAMQEVINLAQAQSIPLPSDLIERNCNFINSLHDQGALIASQYTDIITGKKIELEWVQGIIHRLGLLHNVNTAIHSTCYISLRKYIK